MNNFDRADIRYMVSFQEKRYSSHDCGNKTFDDQESAEKYILQNEIDWKSYSLFWFRDEGFMNDMYEIYSKTDKVRQL